MSRRLREVQHMSGASGKWSASRVMTGVAALVALGSFTVLAPVGCGTESMFGPPGEGGGFTTTGAGFASGTGAGNPGEPCSPDGSMKSCHVVIGNHNGVTNCEDGVQVCFQGVWGICSPDPGAAPSGHRPLTLTAPDQSGDGFDNPVVDQALGGTAYPTPLSNSGPMPCGDKCDPSCMQIVETAPMGGQASGTNTSTWFISPRSQVTGAQGSIMGQGYVQPCGAAWDCEFDQYCSNPVTSGSPLFCHDKCAVGGPMGLCSDACVQAVVGAVPHCGALPLLGGVWDVACVQAVHQYCGQDCYNNEPNCAHDLCLTGEALASGCDNTSNSALSCVSQICGTNPGCCGALFGTWDSNCVAAVNATCGLSCPSAAQTGVCLPWTPGMTDPDPSCSNLPDLTAGVPCMETTAPNQEIIPICNVGGAAANPPITLNIYPGGSGHAPNYPPGNTPHNITIMQPIPSGKCIDVADGTTHTGDEFFINPPGAGHIAECDDQNNWGIRIGGGSAPNCDTPSCVPNQNTVFTRPTNLYLMVDRSSGLGTGVLTQIKAGLNGFFTSAPTFGTNPPAAMDVSVWEGSFPNGGCTATGFGSCPSTSGGQTPCNSNGLTSINPSTPGSVTTWVNNLTQSGNLGPYSSALGTALNQATADFNSTTTLWNIPFPLVVLILGTDPTLGPNQDCGSSWKMNALAGQAAAAYAATTNATEAGVRTFVIWIGNPETMPGEDVNQIVNAGHGKLYSTGNDSGGTLASDITSALQDIVANQAYPCSVQMPAPGTFSTASPTITYTQGATKTTIPQDQNCSTPTGGWYWSPNPSAPTAITLCPQTCPAFTTAAAQAVPTFVTYKPGCQALYTTTSVPGVTYTGDCSGSPGTSVQWRWLAYDTDTPMNTSVDFYVQTGAMTSAAKVASSSSSQPVCALLMGGGCPVDLVAALDNGLNSGPAISNTITVSAVLNPDPSQTHAPGINGWTIQYSCIDTQ